jgi:hypothetical protein
MGSGTVVAAAASGIVAFDNVLWRLLRNPQASVSTLGTGCPGAYGPLTLAATSFPGSTVPVLGSGVTFTVTGYSPLPFAHTYFIVGFDRNVWGGSPLPLSLAGFGMPGCTLYESIDALVTYGYGSFTITLPPAQQFLGFHFYVQALVQDFGLSGPSMAVSDALDCAIGVNS